MTQPTVTPVASTSSYWTDVVERVALTYIETFLGLLLVNAANFTNINELFTAGRSAALAAFPAALSLIKAIVAKQIGNGDSASLAKDV